jgi:hypothetical protein
MMDELQIYFKRTINPTDFSLTAAGITENTSEPVQDVYKWVLQMFNINDPVHHLVLITAILFTKARPYLAWPENAKDKIPDVDQLANVNARKLIMSRYIYQLDWCDGRTEKKPPQGRWTVRSYFCGILYGICW